MIRSLRVSLLTVAAWMGACASPPESGSSLPRTFEEFKASLPHDPATGRYAVEGDMMMGEELLRAYYGEAVQRVAARPASTGDVQVTSQPLAVLNINGADYRWNATEKMNLTYCVDRATFGSNYQTMVDQMNVAAVNWEVSAHVDFRHLPAHDSNCTTANTGVFFNVIQGEPRNRENGAEAFFPGEPRSRRFVVVRPDMAGHQDGSILSALMMHELGHTLGFRHETMRSGGTCVDRESPNWRPLSDFDADSIMGCRGLPFSRTLSATDRSAARCLYGPPPGQPAEPNCHDNTRLLFEGVMSQAHIQDFGWLPLVQNNDVAGSVGYHKRLEAFRLLPVQTAPGLRICYRAWVIGDADWQPERCNGEVAGTEGASRAIQAFRVNLVNGPPGCIASYRAHLQDSGWTAENFFNDEMRGNTNGIRMEAIQVRLSPQCL